MSAHSPGAARYGEHPAGHRDKDGREDQEQAWSEAALIRPDPVDARIVGEVPDIDAPFTLREQVRLTGHTAEVIDVCPVSVEGESHNVRCLVKAGRVRASYGRHDGHAAAIQLMPLPKCPAQVRDRREPDRKQKQRECERSTRSGRGRPARRDQ